MLTLAAFLIAIGLLVIVHEWGHYAMALACNVKVLRFSVGFGPKVWGWVSPKTGTEFVLSALPLGGYVKMLDEREGAVLAHEKTRAFNTQSLKRRALIVAAGPAANLVFAVILYACLNWSGVEQAQAVLSKPLQGSIAAQAGLVGGELMQKAGFEGSAMQDLDSFEDFRWWLTRAALEHRNLQIEYKPLFEGSSRVAVLPLDKIDVRNADARMFRAIGILGPLSQARMGGLSADGAAEIAGLKVNDLVVSVNGVSIVDAGHLRELIRSAAVDGATAPQTWVVDREGGQLSLVVKPRAEMDGVEWVGRVGAFIGAPPALNLVRYGPLEGISRAVERTWEVSILTLRMMGSIVVGDASLKNISGPITIADYAGKSAALGVSQFLIFLALISISLGVMNLLPLPVLDGGHLMYYLWESITGKAVSDLAMEWLQRMGLGVLMAMMSVAVFNDVIRLLG
jgi:regulator of sigma E protease